MQEIDVLLDDKPELSKELVELDNRNRQAHKELQVYNDTGNFVFKHPLALKKKHYEDSYSELIAMKRTKPSTFMKEVTNVTQNIRRIKSRLKNGKYKSDEEKQAWEDNLLRAEIRMTVLKEIIRK